MEPLKAINSQKKNVTQTTMLIMHLRDVRPMTKRLLQWPSLALKKPGLSVS